MADKGRAMLAALPSSRFTATRTRLPSDSSPVPAQKQPGETDAEQAIPRITTEMRRSREMRKTSGSTAASFVERTIGMVNREDINSILELQNNMLQRFEKSNTQLDRLNEFSRQRYLKTVEQFRHHTRILVKMKRDLDSVFRRIKDLKQRLHGQYPMDFILIAGDAGDDVTGLEEGTEEEEVEIDTRTSRVEEEAASEAKPDT
ncbi:kxDL motif-containing protein 1-like [Corticium candelabrum]|uniref:kxDL motif-containing protein 1-like n=1 Tax=Corticium candelabrum TaxID=121492 RepID=UPI002E25AD0E|nr:kxDL motif-containing protein 1-like [Corticium candelabrum]